MTSNKDNFIFSVKPKCTTFNCSNCDAVGRLTCTKCRAVKYCSAVCQKNNWKTHKPFCISLSRFREDKLEDLKQREDLEQRNFLRQAAEYASTLFQCFVDNCSCLAFELASEHLVNLKTDYQDMRYKFVCTLLSQGRFQSVYSIIKDAVCSQSKENPDDYLYPEELVKSFDHTPYPDFNEDMFEDWKSVMASNGKLFDIEMKEDDCSIYDLFVFNKPALVTLFLLFTLKVNLEICMTLGLQGFNTFLLGTIPKTSNNPALQKLYCNYPVLKKILSYLVPATNIKSRVKLLQEQQIELFYAIEGYNMYAVPILVNNNPIPEILLETKFVDWEKPHAVSGEIVSLLRFVRIMGDAVKGALDRLTLYFEVVAKDAEGKDWEESLCFTVERARHDILRYVKRYNGIPDLFDIDGLLDPLSLFYHVMTNSTDIVEDY